MRSYKRILVLPLLFITTMALFAGGGSEQTSPSGSEEGSGTIVTMDIPYTVDGENFIGYLAYDESITSPQPGVLVVHEWRGINTYARRRAEDLAKEGYVAFAVDLYGDGIEIPRSEAPAKAGEIGSDFPLIETRFNAALDIIKSYEQTDSDRIAAIGYCFGGGIVLNMARMGTEIAGVVSFHGSLNTGLNANPGDIKTKVLAIQGDKDPVAPLERQVAFRNEMDASGAEYTYIIYDDVAAHNFTNPEGDTYFENEAEMAWQEMLDFFDAIF